jgi:hypothetical protein
MVELMKLWDEGWDCLFQALNAIKPEDLEKIVYIRKEGQTVMEAINRQVAHYCYHVGQIVYLAKELKGREWISLSIPRGKSEEFNKGNLVRSKLKLFTIKIRLNEAINFTLCLISDIGIFTKGETGFEIRDQVQSGFLSNFKTSQFIPAEKAGSV